MEKINENIFVYNEQLTHQIDILFLFAKGGVIGERRIM